MDDLISRVRADRDKLQHQRERLLSGVAAIDAKLTELVAALRVLERYAHSSEPVTNLPGHLDEQAERPGRGHQKRLIQMALAANVSLGKTVSDIQEWIREHDGTEVSANTVSVTLPRLRGAGIARLEGRHWFYVPGHSGEATEERTSNPSAEPPTTTEEEANMDPPG